MPAVEFLHALTISGGSFQKADGKSNQGVGIHPSTRGLLFNEGPLRCSHSHCEGFGELGVRGLVHGEQTWSEDAAGWGNTSACPGVSEEFRPKTRPTGI